MKRKIDAMLWITLLEIGVLIIFLLSVGIKFITKNIFLEKMQKTGPVVEWILAGDEEAQNHIKCVRYGYPIEKQVSINWRELYPLEEVTVQDIDTSSNEVINKYIGLVNRIQDLADIYTGDLLLGQKELATISGMQEKVMGWNLTNLTGNDIEQIIYMDNGSLTYVEGTRTNEEIQEYSLRLRDFSEYLMDKGIGFTYVNSASKVCKYDKCIPDMANEHTNENADALLTALAEANVNVLDMRMELHEDNIDHASAFYRTDHHWKTETGFWAAGVLTDYIQKTYDMECAPELLTNDNYTITNYEKWLFGPQGKKATWAKAEPEDVKVIVPNYETNFRVEIPSKDFVIEGDFKEAFMNMMPFEKRDYVGKDAYYMWNIQNDPVVHIDNINPSINKDKKLLMIQDSYCWPVTPYLATQYSEIDILNLNAFNGSVRRYIEEYQPDVVIMMLCEREIHLHDLK